MKYIKTFESINKEDIVKTKINFDIIDDIENLSISYLDDGWHIAISIKSPDGNVYFYKIVGHSRQVDGVVVNQDYILPSFYFDPSKGINIDSLIYKFMIFYPINPAEFINHLSEEEENIDASNDILKAIKELYPDEKIEVDIYVEEEEDEYN